jgi:alkanesulfonate monooxygenase SsuD/methylene tetrahydromethanopterin reductase-like flavin-dependent oxidoreductase (luciferase family)
VVVTTWDHPVRVAERAALLDSLSGGRLELGVGRGAGAHEDDVFGIALDVAAKTRMFQESVEIIRGLWSGDEFGFEGEFFTFDPVIMIPRPVQQPAPLFIGSGSLDSAGWAARQHVPYATITWPLMEPQAYVDRIEHFRKEAAGSGYDLSDVRVPHVLLMHCEETDEAAAETALHWMHRYQYVLESHYEFARRDGVNAAVFADREKLARFPIEHLLVGSPETCVKRLHWFVDNVGVDYVLVNVGFGGMPLEKTLPSLELFMAEVVPHFTPAGDLVGRPS